MIDEGEVVYVRDGSDQDGSAGDVLEVEERDGEGWALVLFRDGYREWYRLALLELA